MMSAIGPHAGHRRADAQAGEADFRNRRVDDAARPELLDEPLQNLECGAGLGDVLAHEDDRRVAAHSSAIASRTASPNPISLVASRVAGAVAVAASEA
jgi:hypothetical protein